MSLDLLLQLSLVLFMAGSLLDMGMGLSLSAALFGLRNPRFLAGGLVFGFVLGPALAWLLTRIIPLQPSHATGLILLGLTPCAPFLPLMVARAQGDARCTAAMLVIAAIGSVAMMPVAVPLLAPGFAADAWAIARPLLLLVLLPLLAGMAMFRASPAVAAAMQPFVRMCVTFSIVALLLLSTFIYWRGALAAVGSFAIAAQFLFLGTMTASAYGLGLGLPQAQRSVLGLGVCTRNVGAALAPLLSAATVDERAVVMVVLAVPIQIIVALVAARWFARRARRAAAPGRGDAA
jgi:BASS family bile acid:Na+ symporter